MNRTDLLNQLAALDFALLDLQLFLNTHPQNGEALQMYADCLRQSTAVRNAFEQRFGPLTPRCCADDGKWLWGEQPWPWQLEEGSAL